MTITLTTDVGGVVSNSYLSEADATAYITVSVMDRTLRDYWAKALPDDRARALIKATQLLDIAIRWAGYKATAEQALQWPRADMYDASLYSISDTVIPSAVKAAQAETAVWLLSKAGVNPTSTDAQFDVIKIGPITLDYAENKLGSSQEYLPSIVQSLIAAYGSINTPTSGGIRMIPLVRG